MQTAELSIFIIEDDRHFRETFIDVMGLNGVPAHGVGSATEGLAALAAMKTPPSVIVLDVKLPDAHGFDLCRKIKKQAAFKDVPVIFVSAATRYHDASDRAEGLLAGASLFIPKPVSIERLWKEISGLLRR